MDKKLHRQEVIERICKLMKIRVSQRCLLTDVKIIYFKAFYEVVEFTYKEHKYEYRDNMVDPNGWWIEDKETNKQILFA